jgi:hypothetical protein
MTNIQGRKYGDASLSTYPEFAIGYREEMPKRLTDSETTKSVLAAIADGNGDYRSDSKAPSSAVSLGLAVSVWIFFCSSANVFLWRLPAPESSIPKMSFMTTP